jgi:hypothetical protein
VTEPRTATTTTAAATFASRKRFKRSGWTAAVLPRSRCGAARCFVCACASKSMQLYRITADPQTERVVTYRMCVCATHVFSV